MNRKNPVISIIMATYNRAHLIEETLISIQHQTYTSWECLIIDDGSQDNTEDVIKVFSNSDRRFKYFPRDVNYKKGLPGSRNMGLKLAQGDYIIFYDDDDIVHPENLQICLNHLKNSKFYFCRYNKKPFRGFNNGLEFNKIHNQVVNDFKISDLDKMITGKIPFASCCVMWDRRCFEENRFNENLMYAEEWECYSRILSQGYEGLSIEEVLYFNRKHPNSNTGQFQQNFPIRINSQIQAAILIINNLALKDLFNDKLKMFFVRMGIELNSPEIFKKSLDAAGLNTLQKLKYQIGYKLYPILKPIFYIKGKIQKS